MGFGRRNRNSIFNALSQKGSALVCTTDTKLYIPTWYQDKELYVPGETIRYAGNALVKIGDNYAIFSIPAMLKATPTELSREKVDEEEYIVAGFKKGDKIIHSNEIVVNGYVAQTLLDSFTFKGKYPAWMTYEDALFYLELADEVSGIKLNASPGLKDLIISLGARSVDNHDKFSRLTDKNATNFTQEKMKFVGLYNTAYASQTTFSKIIGSYQEAGLTAALLTDSDVKAEPSSIEKIYRS